MTLESLKKLLTAYGWTLSLQRRKNSQWLYAIAKKRFEGQILTRYIAAEKRLATLSETDIVARLALQAAQLHSV